MLGWDGLGLVSFFLIVYYQSQSSITSGLFTLLINRIGDCFFLVTIVLYFCSLGYGGFSFGGFFMDFYLSLFLVLTFMTKRAIFPFSPWLPLAMAAPTPISALVHSSTLVTAGLYLMIRYPDLILSSPNLCSVLCILCIFTSFYAGFNSVFETDLKKLIALSTLSHLGFIGTAFSVGLINLAFFHMLTHALFKSLLFMAIGDIITVLSHSQDIRYLSSGLNLTPASSSIISVSILNLLGIPSLRGFFSKDLVLESLHFSGFSFLLVAIMFCNVVFTYFYSYQLFFFMFQPRKVNPYLITHSYGSLHSYLLFLLALGGVFLSYTYFNIIYTRVLFSTVPFLFKILPITLNFSLFLFLLLNGRQFTSKNTSL
jgi:NADH-ubiquinone oxidoreductase chain 5